MTGEELEGPGEQGGQVPPIPETRPNIGTKKPFISAILVVVIVLLLFGAVYAGMKIQEKKQIPTPSAKITPSQHIPTAVPTTDPTEGWKTYTNTFGGFTMEYPVDLSVVEKMFSEKDGRVMLTSSTGGSLEIDMADSDYSPGWGGGGCIDYEQVRFLGESRRVCILKNGLNFGAENSGKTKNFNITALYGSGLPENIALQILFNLKFLDSHETNKASDETILIEWETYTDSRYGFQFKYPTGVKIEVSDDNNNFARYVSVTDPTNKYDYLYMQIQAVELSKLTTETKCEGRREFRESQGGVIEDFYIEGAPNKGWLAKIHKSGPGGEVDDVLCFEEGNLLYEIDTNLGIPQLVVRDTELRMVHSFKFPQ